MDYEKFKIKEYKYWSIFLHQDQTNLGRIYIWCNRQNVVDFLDMTKAEKEEFFKVAKKLRSVLTKLFKPNLFNYASLANATRHLHVHVISRYSRPRKFMGVTFEDKRWGQNYRSNPEFKISEEILLKIKDKIKSNL